MTSTIPVPRGHVAAVITHMDMRTPPPFADLPDTGVVLEQWDRPDPDVYRALFRKVGAPWLWVSRLEMGDAALKAITHDTRVHVYVVRDKDGNDAGLVELDYREQNTCEIVFLGLVPGMSGLGHGRWLMNEILLQAWAARGIARIWLHSCSLDHAGALRFYERSGFTAFARELETFPDPRLTGLLPRDAAPHVPLVGGD